MAAQELITILERTVTGCRCCTIDASTNPLLPPFLAQADLENARHFLDRAAEQNLVGQRECHHTQRTSSLSSAGTFEATLRYFKCHHEQSSRSYTSR